MTIDFNHLTTNWKSTLQSFLTVALVTTAALVGCKCLTPEHAAILLSAQGSLKIIVGILQTDGIQVPAGSQIDTKTTVTTPEEK